MGRFNLEKKIDKDNLVFSYPIWVVHDNLSTYFNLIFVLTDFAYRTVTYLYILSIYITQFNMPG